MAQAVVCYQVQQVLAGVGLSYHISKKHGRKIGAGLFGCADGVAPGGHTKFFSANAWSAGFLSCTLKYKVLL